MTGLPPADLTPPEVSAEAARRAAEEVLADPAFARPGPGLVARARDWVLERLGDLVDDLLASGGGEWLAWVVVAALAVAAVVFAVRVTRGVQRDPAVAGETTGAPGRPARDWLAEAAQLEATGEWRAALRCRYRGLVAALAAGGVVAEVPGRTAGEYRAEVEATAPGVAPEFAGATSLFEAAWYGGRPVGPEEGRELADLAQRVLAGTGRPG